MAVDKSTIDIFENPLNNLFPFLKYGATPASPYALLTLNYCLSWVYPDPIGRNKFIRVSFHKYGDKFFPGTGDMKSVEEFGNRADRMSIGTNEIFLYASTDIEPSDAASGPILPMNARRPCDDSDPNDSR